MTGVRPRSVVPRPSLGGAVHVLARLVAAVLLAVVLLRLSGWSRGPATALVLVALPLVLLPSYAVALVAAWRRDAPLGAVAAVLVLAHVLVVLPGLGAADLPPGARDAPRLRVVVANVLSNNAELDRLSRTLTALEPDVLVVAELRPRVLEGLRRGGVLDLLPHSTVRAAPGDVELFSRLPLEQVEHTEAVPGQPQPGAVVRVGRVPVQLRGAHPLPPVHGREAQGRRTLRALVEDVSGDRLPVVVAGDLNGDRDLPAVRELFDLGLRDAAEERGRGLSRTWPQRWPLLALDHVLVRDGDGGRLAVLDQREAALPGSDHRAVVADLAVLPA